MTKLLITATLILGFAMPAQAAYYGNVHPQGYQYQYTPPVYWYWNPYAYAYAYAYYPPLNQPYLRPGHQPWKYYHTEGR